MGGIASIEGGTRRASQARGVPAIEGADAPYEDWLCQYFYPLLIPNKKRTSHMIGSLTFPEFVSKNPNFPDLAQ